MYIYESNRRGRSTEYIVPLPRAMSSFHQHMMSEISQSFNMREPQARSPYQEPLSIIPVYKVEGDLGDCNICLEKLELGQDFRRLPCSVNANHCYHKNCIDPWLKSHGTCPTCRADICKEYAHVEQMPLQLFMHRT